MGESQTDTGLCAHGICVTVALNRFFARFPDDSRPLGQFRLEVGREFFRMLPASFAPKVPKRSRTAR